MNKTIEEQKAAAALLLKELAPDVVATDKAKASLKFHCSVEVVARYLRGTISRVELATDLYKFLKKRVDARKETVKA